MSSTKDDSRISQLRLASARRRVFAFLEQIEHLEASSFPHPDGRAALQQIRENIEIRATGLERLVGLSADIIDQGCTQASLWIQRYTQLLGFILRSTNVRNAFELHFPLKRLVKDVIGGDAKLLISSEWNFVPFTYPMTIDVLRDFALVGLPATESNNVLLIPLAGHEIGHSAWRHHQLKDEMIAALAKEVDDVLKADAQATQTLIDELNKASHSEDEIRPWCLDSGIRQLEEIFCDLFGLYVFGVSYLYAFNYFLAPGGGGRSIHYPSDADRIRHLVDAAQSLNIAVDSDIFERWQSSSPTPNIVTSLLGVTDSAVSRVVEQLRTRTFELLKSKGVTTNAPNAIDRVVAAFKRGEPDSQGATLSEIVTAGWMILREKGGLADPKQERDQYNLLSELMLKSVEVSEFRLRVSHDA